ncbi:MAG: CopG family transcriptional regulator, nickel-responsive regulator [Thermoplasmata archaeon]|jgi:CopG family nickel-responsive transcriptional regulator|nr:CopG family transcriptional regulator, nickel-responsive regulator [Thermoplasmata archaeon]
MAVVSISLPDALLGKADALIEKRGFSGRSELLRACLRDYLVATAAEDREGDRSASVTLVYPHGEEKPFARIRHEYADVVRSMMHGHARKACIEIFVVEGPAARVRGFVDALRGTRSALQVGAVYADAWGEDDHEHETHEEPAPPRRGRAPSAAKKRS